MAEAMSAENRGIRHQTTSNSPSAKMGPVPVQQGSQCPDYASSSRGTDLKWRSPPPGEPPSPTPLPLPRSNRSPVGSAPPPPFMGSASQKPRPTASIAPPAGSVKTSQQVSASADPSHTHTPLQGHPRRTPREHTFTRSYWS